MPEISIVLPVYNGEKYLRKSIDSVIAQTFKDWELIIVDDCSSDSSPEIMEEYACRDKRIKVIHNLINKKLPETLNIGFRSANGKYLTWTSDDNQYRPEALSKMFGYLSKNNSVPMVRADMSIVDENGNLIVVQDSYQNKALYYRNTIGACFLYKREVLDSVGEYDKDLFLVEDYDYWFRISKRYGEIASLNEDLYIYLHHSQSLTVEKKELVQKQIARFRAKHLEAIVQGLIDNMMMDELFHVFISQKQYLDIDEKIGNLVFLKLPFLKNYRKISSMEQCIVYGAGHYGKEYMSDNRDQVICVVDKDEHKWNKRVLGKETMSLQESKKKYHDYPVVIAISPLSQMEVAKILYDNGMIYSVYPIG